LFKKRKGKEEEKEIGKKRRKIRKKAFSCGGAAT